MRSQFIRCPGGKSRNTEKILQFVKKNEKNYRELFLGGGSVFLSGGFQNAWLNDKDFGVYDLWRLVRDTPDIIINLIKEHTSILEHQYHKSKITEAISLWRLIKNDSQYQLFPAGYRFLFLTKTCFNGVVTGGPTGGVEQKSKYSITARWAANKTINKINAAHRKLQSAKITNLSWEDVLEVQGNDVCVYLDPPYLKKGKQCYVLYFSEEDHKKLAEHVLRCGHRYIVTVDDCSEIRKIWLDAGVDEKHMIPFEWTYSMSDFRDKNRVGKELFIVDAISYDIYKFRLKNKDIFATV